MRQKSVKVVQEALFKWKKLGKNAQIYTCGKSLV